MWHVLRPLSCKKLRQNWPLLLSRLPLQVSHICIKMSMCRYAYVSWQCRVWLTGTGASILVTTKMAPASEVFSAGGHGKDKNQWLSLLWVSDDSFWVVFTFVACLTFLLFCRLDRVFCRWTPGASGSAYIAGINDCKGATWWHSSNKRSPMGRSPFLE